MHHTKMPIACRACCPYTMLSSAVQSNRQWKCYWPLVSRMQETMRSVLWVCTCIYAHRTMLLFLCLCMLASRICMKLFVASASSYLWSNLLICAWSQVLVNRVGRAWSRPNVMSDRVWASKPSEGIGTICTDTCMLKLPIDWLQGQSLLHLAVLQSSPDIVEVLLRHGVDVNMLDMMVSCQNGCEEAELLHTQITSHSGCCRGTHRFMWLQKKLFHALWNSCWSMMQM